MITFRRLIAVVDRYKFSQTWCVELGYIYRPQQSWAKVMFLQVCVCPPGRGRGVCLIAYWDTPRTRPPLKTGTPLGADAPLDQAPPQDQTPPPGADTPPPPSRLQHTVKERPVRILLECILVWGLFMQSFVKSRHTFTGYIRPLLIVISGAFLSGIAKKVGSDRLVNDVLTYKCVPCTSETDEKCKYNVTNLAVMPPLVTSVFPLNGSRWLKGHGLNQVWFW